jgi:hypothetical protein
MPPQPTNGSSEKAHGIGVHVTKVRMDATQAARGVAMQYPLRKVLLFCKVCRIHQNSYQYAIGIS